MDPEKQFFEWMKVPVFEEAAEKYFAQRRDKDKDKMAPSEGAADEVQEDAETEGARDRANERVEEGDGEDGEDGDGNVEDGVGAPETRQTRSKSKSRSPARLSRLPAKTLKGQKVKWRPKTFPTDQQVVRFLFVSSSTDLPATGRSSRAVRAAPAWVLSAGVPLQTPGISKMGAGNARRPTGVSTASWGMEEIGCGGMFRVRKQSGWTNGRCTSPTRTSRR